MEFLNIYVEHEEMVDEAINVPISEETNVLVSEATNVPTSKAVKKGGERVQVGKKSGKRVAKKGIEKGETSKKKRSNRET